MTALAPPENKSPPIAPAGPVRGSWIDYLAIARPDHWFKNVFMLAGIVLAYFYHFTDIAQVSIVTIVAALIATCLAASSNYVINEVLDAPSDLEHPVKRNRPVPSGRISLRWAYLEWLALGAAALAIAASINKPFLAAVAALLVMGMIYNIPPIRSKDLPYLDVLSESINNPIRLALGWFAVVSYAMPPLSLVLAYWLIGAFFMAVKRFAEYRSIGDAAVAGAYRRSFRHYDEESLLVSLFFYASGSALFLGMFIIKYHLELILAVPLIAGFFSYYMRVALKKNSAVQNPERLYREKGLMAYLVVCVTAFLGLMFVQIPQLYEWLNVPQSTLPALWRW
jgi:decaprenyl-phosphate phosphoribosyltransferase